MRSRPFLPLLLAGALLVCGRAAPPPAPLAPPEAGLNRFEAFSLERAWADLEAFSAIGSRVSGSRGARSARQYIRSQLATVGVDGDKVTTRVELEGLEPLQLTHVVAIIPGTSPQLFVLVAPYDSSGFDDVAFIGTNDGASGAALLLEFARVLSNQPLPYTTRLVFLDGEGRLGRHGPGLEDRRGFGSRSLAERMQEEGELDAIRLLVAFNRVCDADLRIARDLGSHRIYREEFWRTAARLGREDAFRPGDAFESSLSSHVAFRELGVRPTVAIEDTAFGGEAPPGIYADTEQDDLEHCSPESLETVGAVSLAAIETIGDRLAKIDRFARSPLIEMELPAVDADSAGSLPLSSPR
jgi:glutaminyl-peptide cyclotransferase